MEFVNNATGLELHQFKWLADERLIGVLPPRWNHLVGYDEPRADAALLHYTHGGPWFTQHVASEYAAEWVTERDHMLQVIER